MAIRRSTNLNDPETKVVIAWLRKVDLVVTPMTIRLAKQLLAESNMHNRNTDIIRKAANE